MPEYLPTTPSSIVYLLTGVRLDNTYENTIFFQATQNQTVEEVQHAYFLNKVLNVGGTYTGLTYQRVDKNKMRLPINIDTAMKADYIMFINPAFENKWFYAFIDNVSYINNNVTEIEYEIDVMQTWFYDCTLLESFIEREHSATDAPGDNLVDENLNIGNEYFVAYQQIKDLSSCDLYAVYTVPTSAGSLQANCQIIDNKVFTGISYVRVGLIDDTNLVTLANWVAEHNANLQTLFQFPTALEPSYTPGYWENSEAIDCSITNDFDVIYPASNRESYIPKNQKLNTYPFKCLRVYNNVGSASIYRFENFAGKFNAPFVFKIEGTFAPQQEIACYPYNYLGVENNYNEGLSLDCSMDCPFTVDTFAQWWERNRAQFITKAITSIALPAINMGFTTSELPSLLPNMGLAARQRSYIEFDSKVNRGLMGLMSGAGNVMNLAAQSVDMIAAPDSTRGQVSNNSILYKQQRFGFTFQALTIKKYYAIMIDQVFDLYGYMTKKIKTPNISVRPYWCYTKTAGCNIVPKNNKLVGATEIKAIKSIFDRGVRFWKNGDNIGDYSLDNRVYIP